MLAEGWYYAGSLLRKLIRYILLDMLIGSVRTRTVCQLHSIRPLRLPASRVVIRRHHSVCLPAVIFASETGTIYSKHPYASINFRELPCPWLRVCVHAVVPSERYTSNTTQTCTLTE